MTGAGALGAPTKPKLTKAQEELLNRLSARGVTRTAKNYSTAYVLKRLGFVTIEDVPPPYGWRVAITELGRAAVNQAEG